MKKPASIIQREVIKQQPTRGGDPFYSSRRWRKVRNYKIMLNPLCEECLLSGITTQADEVDHSKPRKPTGYTGATPAGGWGSDYDIINLRSLCKPHHASKSSKERGSYEGGRG